MRLFRGRQISSLLGRTQVAACRCVLEHIANSDTRDNGAQLGACRWGPHASGEVAIMEPTHRKSVNCHRDRRESFSGFEQTPSDFSFLCQSVTDFCFCLAHRPSKICQSLPKICRQSVTHLTDFLSLTAFLTAETRWIDRKAPTAWRHSPAKIPDRRNIYSCAYFQQLPATWSIQHKQNS